MIHVAAPAPLRPVGVPRARPSRRPRALRSKRSRAQAPRHAARSYGMPYRTGDGGYSFSPKQPWKPKNAINPSKKRVPSEGEGEGDAFPFALSGMLGRPPETTATDEALPPLKGPDAGTCSAKASAVAACTALPLAGPG